MIEKKVLVLMGKSVKQKAISPIFELGGKVAKYIDIHMERYGVSSGLAIAQRKMKKVIITFNSSLHAKTVESCLLEDFDSYESMLRNNGFLRKNESIGGYRLTRSTLVLFLVDRLGNVLLM